MQDDQMQDTPPEPVQEDTPASDEVIDRDDLVCTMIADADEWARKELERLTSTANNNIRTYISLESTDIQKRRSEGVEGKRFAKISAKKAMKAIQEELNRVLRQIATDVEYDLTAIRDKYGVLCTRASEQMTKQVDQVTSSVADFTQAVQELTTEQLLGLREVGVLRLEDRYLVVPGAGRIEEVGDESQERE